MGRPGKPRNNADRAAARRMIWLLKQGHDVRRQVRRIRARVRSGCYENDLKLTIAIERLMRELQS